MVESILYNPNNYLRKTTALSKALEDRFRRLTAVTPSSVNIDAVLGEDQKENVHEDALNEVPFSFGSSEEKIYYI